MHPNRIGPYLIEKRIGAGGMANVYLARHEQTNQVVAVKELPASLAREEGFIHRFDREIEALRKLNCPNIVKLFDSGQDDEIYYYAMEYVDGETLTTRLRRERRIPWQEAIEISRQICVGLKHAHDAGVIHRDLKPSNLMLGKDGVVKITDFGVAQVFAADRLTATGGIIGTAEFMSPEQVKGSRIEKRSDLYSLGAVLYTMLVGQPPFTGPTASDIMHKQRFARFDPPKNHVPEIPGWLNDIVCQLLEKEPDKRPPDAFVTSKRLQEVVKKVELFETGFVASSSDITTAENGIVEKPLGGTFVRDLLRLQVSSREPTTLVERALNNTWVLLSLLLLVILGASGLFWQTRRSTETTDINSTTITEAERILQLARWRWKGGDSDSALKQLDALQALIQHEPHQQSLVHSIERLRTAIGKQTRTPDQPAFVEQALKRASELAPEQRAEAQKIYEGIIALYQSDPRLDDYVAQAQAKLKEIQEPAAQ